MKALQPPDSYLVHAAQDWLELGNHLEADAELDNITGSIDLDLTGETDASVML